MFEVKDFFDLSQEPLAFLFADCELIWQVLPKINAAAVELAKGPILGSVHPTTVLEGAVAIGEGSLIEPHVYIKGPVYIGKNTVVRQGAYIRENNIIGDNCIVGHASELKGSILLTGAHAPHFAYVGDSVLGRDVNLGAGTKLANFKLSGDQVNIWLEGKRIPTGLRKFGAILGDAVSIGCNSVTAPGTVIGKNTWVYSMLSLRGYIAPNSLVKYDYNAEIVPKTL
ncbi:MAG: glucose-1-phosphate thymidylyltransferase [Negativicutes bacterium]|nr:glucose-1-phosphate thymidylyltransferase [Negativicutes bacterium]